MAQVKVGEETFFCNCSYPDKDGNTLCVKKINEKDLEAKKCSDVCPIGKR